MLVVSGLEGEGLAEFPVHAAGQVRPAVSLYGRRELYITATQRSGSCILVCILLVP